MRTPAPVSMAGAALRLALGTQGCLGCGVDGTRKDFDQLSPPFIRPHRKPQRHRRASLRAISSPAQEPRTSGSEAAPDALDLAGHGLLAEIRAELTKCLGPPRGAWRLPCSVGAQRAMRSPAVTSGGIEQGGGTYCRTSWPAWPSRS